MKLKSKIITLCSLLAIIIATVLVLYYVIAYSKYEFHADFTDTIMWAQASIDARRLLNPDFYYAATLPFGGHLIMIPFVLIFDVSLTAHILGMVTFTLLFILGLILLGRAMRWSLPMISFFVSSTLLVLSLSAKLREIYWGHIIYYSLGILFMLVGLTLIFKTINHLDNKKPQLTLYILSAVWFFLCATNLLQSFIIFIVPALGSVILVRFFEVNEPLFSKRNLPYFQYVFICFLASCLGFMVGLILTKNYGGTYADAYSTFSAPSEWMNNLHRFLNHWTSLLGVNVLDGQPFSNKVGIINLIKIMFSILLLVLPIIMIKSYRKLDYYQKVLLLYHWIMTFLIMLGYIFGRLSAANWRLSPIVATSVITALSYIYYLFKDVKLQRFGVVLASVFVIIIYLSASTIKPDTNNNSDIFSVIDLLEEKNLTYGYATFWQANNITVLSNSKIKSRCIEIQNGSYNNCTYQTNKNWYKDQPNQSNYFLLLTKNEYNNLRIYNSHFVNTAQEKIEHENFVILVFEENIFTD